MYIRVHLHMLMHAVVDAYVIYNRVLVGDLFHVFFLRLPLLNTLNTSESATGATCIWYILCMQDSLYTKVPL